MMGFLDRSEVLALGFAEVGEKVQISRRAVFHRPDRISIGSRTRIDDFCVLSAGEGGISIGENVHVACFCGFFGAARIELADFSNLSSRVSIYSSSDDFSGRTLTNPTLPPELRGVVSGPVRIGRHVVIGCGSTVLPDVILHDGVAVGAMSLVKTELPEFWICAGVPAVPVRPRSRDLLDLEKQFLNRMQSE